MLWSSGSGCLPPPWIAHRVCRVRAGVDLGHHAVLGLIDILFLKGDNMCVPPGGAPRVAARSTSVTSEPHTTTQARRGVVVVTPRGRQVVRRLGAHAHATL